MDVGGEGLVLERLVSIRPLALRLFLSPRMHAHPVLRVLPHGMLAPLSLPPDRAGREAGCWVLLSRSGRRLPQVYAGGFSGDDGYFWCGGANKKATVYETSTWQEVKQLDQGGNVRRRLSRACMTRVVAGEGPLARAALACGVWRAAAYWLESRAGGGHQRMGTGGRRERIATPVGWSPGRTWRQHACEWVLECRFELAHARS